MRNRVISLSEVAEKHYAGSGSTITKERTDYHSKMVPSGFNIVLSQMTSLCLRASE